MAGVVSLVNGDTGVAVATAPMRHKSEGDRGETLVARNLVRNAGTLEGQTITGDSLHCNRETAGEILRKGGDYLLQLKDNQPTAREYAEALTNSLPLFAPSPKEATAG